MNNLINSNYFYKLPWETILYPYKNLITIPINSGDTLSRIYDIDYDMRINSTASIINPTDISTATYDIIYDFKANNFYSEIVNFFKKDNKLSSIETIPDSEWYFPDLTKDYSMKIVINKTNNQNLLVIHVLPTNKGNVPLVVKDKGVFTLEVRKVADTKTNDWIDYTKQQLISKIDLLHNIIVEKDDTYTIEANGVYDEVETIQLDNGVYYVNATLNYDGAYVNQSAVVKIPK